MRDTTRSGIFVGLIMITAVLAGCSHTNDKMAAMNQESDQLAAELKIADAQMAHNRVRYDDAMSEIRRMRGTLRSAGLPVREPSEPSAALGAKAESPHAKAP